MKKKNLISAVDFKLLYKRLSICISGGQKGGVTCTAPLKGKWQNWELGAWALSFTLDIEWGNLE